MRALSAAARRRRGNTYGVLAGRAGELIRRGRGGSLGRCRRGRGWDLHHAVAARATGLFARVRRRNAQRAVARAAGEPNLSAGTRRSGAGRGRSNGRRSRSSGRRGRLRVRNGTDRDLHLRSALRALALPPRSGVGCAHQFAATGTVKFDGHATLRISDPPLAANASRPTGPMIPKIMPILGLEVLNAKFAARTACWRIGRSGRADCLIRPS